MVAHLLLTASWAVGLLGQAGQAPLQGQGDESAAPSGLGSADARLSRATPFAITFRPFGPLETAGTSVESLAGTTAGVGARRASSMPNLVADDDPAQTEWKRRVIAWAKMSAELPADPQKIASEIRPGTIKNLESQQAGRLQHGGMIFRFAYNEYAMDSDVDLEMAAQGALGNLKATTGITELRYKRTDLKSDGVPGIRLETWYQFQAKPVSYWIVIYGERNRLWQASAMFRTADAEQEGLARRVLDSVKVDRT